MFDQLYCNISVLICEKIVNIAAVDDILVEYRVK